MQDSKTDCVPGDKSSGKDLIYNVRVSVEPGTAARLREDIRREYEADGWTARVRGDNDLQLREDNVTMGAIVFEDDGMAAVSGTGGCAK